jgi:hypothetical protein
METGDRYRKELEGAQSVSGGNDNPELTLSVMAMISYVQTVETQFGWKFVPPESNDPTASSSTGDKDLDELEAYLGVDKDELSAEELLARPYVPTHGDDGATLTASGISTLSAPVE